MSDDKFSDEQREVIQRTAIEQAQAERIERKIIDCETEEFLEQVSAAIVREQLNALHRRKGAA